MDFMVLVKGCRLQSTNWQETIQSNTQEKSSLPWFQGGEIFTKTCAQHLGTAPGNGSMLVDQRFYSELVHLTQLHIYIYVYVSFIFIHIYILHIHIYIYFLYIYMHILYIHMHSVRKKHIYIFHRYLTHIYIYMSYISIHILHKSYISYTHIYILPVYTYLFIHTNYFVYHGNNPGTFGKGTQAIYQAYVSYMVQFCPLYSCYIARVLVPRVAGLFCWIIGYAYS